jgi:hypothetical protein
MENIFVVKTNKTPEINFDIQNSVLRIEGRSIPEHPQEFFEKIERMVQSHLKNKLRFEINLEYFNSSSSKYVLYLLRISKTKFDNLDIVWYVDSDDQDTIDFVENASEMLNHKIEIINYD